MCGGPCTAGWLQGSLGLLTICLAVLMFATAIMTLTEIDSVGETDTAFVAVYSMLFALILFVYEFSKLGCCFDEVESYFGKFFRSNFGFLYSPTSRGLFLIFVAFLQFGGKANPGSKCTDKSNGNCQKYENNNWFGIMTGSFLIVTGIIIVLCGCRYPELMKDKKKPDLPVATPAPVERPRV